MKLLDRETALNIFVLCVFFVTYKVQPLDEVFWLSTFLMSLSCFYTKSFSGGVSLPLVFLCFLSALVFSVSLIVGDLPFEGIDIALKAVILMFFVVKFFAKATPVEVVSAMVLISFIEITYKQVWSVFIETGLRHNGVSLVSGGLTEIHSSAAFLAVIAFVKYQSSTFFTAFFFAVAGSARAAQVVLLSALIKYSKPMTMVIFILAILLLLVFSSELLYETRWSELFSRPLSENQVICNKLNRISGVMMLDDFKILFFGHPFLHDMSSACPKDYFTASLLTLLAPFSSVFAYGILGVVLFMWIILFIPLRDSLELYMVFSLYLLTGAGQFQFFNGTHGDVVYFDGFIVLVFLIGFYINKNRSMANG